ncbi:Septin ring organizing mid2 [Lecanosticta acicola]|uniref:Septin ring organizing mid2 n=1 Tax=Lecanosticta acicola TaxID=111012 RepID=A0AAI8YZF3_9PEZI|nr:Septin ring organizing mid2 [Lecanosticta acicola]
MVRQVQPQPLRISKSTPSKDKDGSNHSSCSSNNGGSSMTSPRPLSEIGSTERRRNSPSYNQATRKMIVSRDSSPYTENSFSSVKDTASPRAFWRGRDPMSPSRFDESENTIERSPSPNLLSPKRRASIEKLKQAGRVKASNIFALENKDAYDPSSLPIVERPTNSRPMSQNLLNNSFTRFDSLRKENNPLSSPGRPSHQRTQSQNAVQILSNPASPSKVALPIFSSPSKKEGTPSPSKSSLARNSQFGSPLEQAVSATWSSGDERAPTPRALHRHNKSVTFHDDPPVINEYEQPTPEPSVSAASDSREGSFDSEEWDPEYSFERGSSADNNRDDSFDEDLENADKTPVVLPEDWSRMSPEEARTDLIDDGDDVFEGSRSPERPILGRSESVASDGESRPLPPLPGLIPKERRNSGISAAAERAALAARNLRSPPKRASCSKDDILNMTRRSSLSLEDRMKLMGSERPSSKHSDSGAVHEELTITNLDTGEKVDLAVKDGEAEGDSVVADLADFSNSPPKISRESILRRVRNSKYDLEEDVDASEFDDESPERPSYTAMAMMDPDQPIPSRENSRETSDHYLGVRIREREVSEEVEIKEEPTEEEIDLASIPVVEEAQPGAPRSPSRMEDYNRESSVLRHDTRFQDEDNDDSGSRYSSAEPEAESTVLNSQEADEIDDGKETLQDAMQLLTVKDYGGPESKPVKRSVSGEFMGLPAYAAMDDFDFDMGRYIQPSPPPSNENTKKLDVTASAPSLQPAAEIKPAIKDLPRPAYDGAEFSPSATPDSVSSVIHHDSEASALEEPSIPIETQHEDSPEIPERRATIRTNGQLKARPSATPADMRMMAEQRRLVSAERPVPAIPQAYHPESEYIAENELEDTKTSTYSSEGNESKADSAIESTAEPTVERSPKRRESKKVAKLNLDIPAFSAEIGEDGLGLDQEFDRVIENQKVGSPFPLSSSARFDPAQQRQFGGLSPFNPAGGLRAAEHHLSHASTSYSPQSASTGAGTNVRKQKGYLMRQNTKVVVASNRNFSNSSRGTVSSNENAGPMSPTGDSRPNSRGKPSRSNSSRKGSADQFLKTEPWNGKARRESQRKASAAQHGTGAVPPLPGQPSALGVVNEDFAAGTGSLEDDVADGVERGRLFVKVVGVKNLDLPMPRNDRLYFQMTLDNGMHCVTTSKMELGKAAPIGQEFELVVLNDLEFQLTLTTKLPSPPKVNTPMPSSPLRTPKHQKSSSLSRFLSSPKKRAERERQEREAAEAEERRLQEEAQRHRASMQPTAWNMLHELVNGSDGAFARAYINLKAHEKQCFGRQLTVDVPCYNEWALEKDSAVVNSVRSKRGNAGPIRKPPYVVGQLELQLLYVPKPAGAADDEMPKSMSSAIREMNKASEVKEVVHESHLSQQGGDCVHWRRRFFRLQGARLTAYHEHTHQKRAVINLSKATRLVDDKSTLVADPKSGNPSSKHGRRKSAFAEDEGYQYVEEGFRIRFANGETIDFYADSAAEKDAWMKMLSQVIGRPDPGKKAATWTDLVLARERVEGIDSAHHAPPTTTDVRDFTKPPAPARKPSDRKAITASKSLPISPMKQAPPERTAPMPPSPTVDDGLRPKTPPMNPRRGHRARDAVKSMIF